MTLLVVVCSENGTLTNCADDGAAGVADVGATPVTLPPARIARAPSSTFMLRIASPFSPAPGPGDVAPNPEAARAARMCGTGRYRPKPPLLTLGPNLSPGAGHYAWRHDAL